MTGRMTTSETVRSPLRNYEIKCEIFRGTAKGPRNVYLHRMQVECRFTGSSQVSAPHRFAIDKFKVPAFLFIASILAAFGEFATYARGSTHYTGGD